MASASPARTLAAEPQPLEELSLPLLGCLRLEIVTRQRSAFRNEYIDRYHYLGHTPLVGAQLWYLVYAEDHHRRTSLPRKRVYLYPLCQNCRTRLANENPGGPA